MKLSPSSSATSVAPGSLAPPGVPYQVRLVVMSEDCDATFMEIELTEPVNIDVNLQTQDIHLGWSSEPTLVLQTDATYTVSCKGLILKRYW